MTFFQIKRHVSFAFSLLLAVSCLSAFALAAPAERDLPIYCVGRDDNVVSLSFDAAWGNEDTQQLIDILAEHDIKATFFVVGEWVDKYPESVKALFDAGHEVMNHSNTHPHFTQLSPTQMAAEVKACADKIESVTGVRPNLFRPPFGDYNDAVVSTMRKEGFYTIQWDVDSLDWKKPGVDAIVKRVLDKTKSGSIILFHNAAEETPAALPTIIDGLIERGFTFAPVSELIYKDGFYMDHTGMQVKQ